MMPRFSPPTAIGLPRSRASAACSTEAKKASASRWMMERSHSMSCINRPRRPRNRSLFFENENEDEDDYPKFATGLFPLSDQRHHHPLYLQFFLWNQVRVTRIFRAQIGFAALHD